MNQNAVTTETLKQNQITEGVIWKQLLLFFFPILFGTFFQQLYNTADAVIVGRFVGKEALAAVGGPTGPLINLLIGFFIGLSSGAGVIISQFYGARQEGQVSRAVHTAMAFSILCGAILMGVGILAAPYALLAMGTPDDILQYAVLYMRIYFAGVIPNLVYNMGAGILRAIGDSKKPLYFLIASCFTNVVLDILFVVYGHMGVMGAALATIISQMVSAVLVILVLIRTRESYHLVPKDIRIDRDMLQRIIRIGFPAGLQSVMYSSSNIIIQSSVNALGTDTIAAWTAYGKIDSVFWMIISAFGIYVYLLFTTDEAVIQKGTQILRYLAPTFFTYVCIEIYSGSLRGAGDCWIPMILTSLGVCALRVVWICVAVPLRPTMETIIFSYPLTWATTSLLFIVYFNWFGKLRRKQFPARIKKKIS